MHIQQNVSHQEPSSAYDSTCRVIRVRLGHVDRREREVPRSVLASCCVCVRGNQSRVFLSQGDPGPEGRVGYDGVPGNAVRKKT